MDSLLSPAVAYAPAIVWLTIVTIAGLMKRRVPLWLVPVAAVVAFYINVTIAGLGPATIAAAITIGLVLLMFFLGILTRTGVVLLPVLLVSLPLLSWVAFLPGYAVAGIVSAARLRKVAGAGYLTMMAGETLNGVGMDANARTAAGVSKPDSSRIPLADPNAGDWSKSIANVKVRLSAYLLASVILTAALAFFVG